MEERGIETDAQRDWGDFFKNAQPQSDDWPDNVREDVVERPTHYRTGGVECIEAMEEASRNADLPPFLGYLWLNAFKYLWRWPYKNGVEDLKKCRWYIDRLISRLEGEDD